MQITVNNISYHIEVVGEGKPILLLHGFTGSLETWSKIVSILKRNSKCILIDIIGHGKTESPTDFRRYELEKVASDILGILNHLGIKKTSVLGYSMGGRLALAFTLLFQNRVEKLILESSSPGLRTDEERSVRRQSDEKLASKISTDGITNFIDYWEEISLFSSQKNLPTNVQEDIRQERLMNNSMGLANSLLGMGTGSQKSYWEQLNTLNIPTLLLSGDLDEKFCLIAENMAKLLKNAKKIKINNAGHAIHVEQPDFFGRIVSEFVNSYIN